MHTIREKKLLSTLKNKEDIIIKQIRRDGISGREFEESAPPIHYEFIEWMESRYSLLGLRSLIKDSPDSAYNYGFICGVAHVLKELKQISYRQHNNGRSPVEK